MWAGSDAPPPDSLRISGRGTSDAVAPAAAAFRKCNLAAQSPADAKAEFLREVEKKLTGKDSERSELANAPAAALLLAEEVCNLFLY
jgi:hypothetical protein